MQYKTMETAEWRKAERKWLLKCHKIQHTHGHDSSSKMASKAEVVKQSSPATSTSCHFIVFL